MEPSAARSCLTSRAAEPRGVKSFPAETPVSRANLEREAEVWFQRGLEMEEAGAPVEETIEAYQKSVN